MSDPRILKFAQILVDHSTRIQPGDRVLIEATTAAEPLVQALYELILQRGGHPHPLMEPIEQKTALFKYGQEEQLKHMPVLRKLAYDEFESRIKILSVADPRALSSADPKKQSLWEATISPILETQMRRGAAKEFKWVSTLFPTAGYAKEAGMSLAEYEDFVYAACHADGKTADPAAYWNNVRVEQQRIVDRFQGSDKITLRGPNVDLSLSVKERTFVNSFGEHNMPDGEFFTGPVEDSVNGWVRYTYPAIRDGRVVEGIELKFEDGKVSSATAESNQDYLLEILETDAGARYVGEFAIGTNFEINRFTGNILFDEKIGGSFHMALGAGYPETGSLNKSAVHWDMICDMRQDAEILVDGEVVFKNGEFVF
ncbi:MAG: aminopeptidase [Anaerolineae bacterium]|nr:aminopeptidase [Anaerolineae bacterium]